MEIPLIGLSQLNRNLETQNRKPALSNLRESGSIEQDADVVFLLDKEKELSPSKDVIRINLAKNRNGETGVVMVEFDKKLGRFSSYHEPVLHDAKTETSSQPSW